MTLQIPRDGLLILSTLVRVHTAPLAHHRHRYIFGNFNSSRPKMKTFSTGCVKYSNDVSDSSQTKLLNSTTVARQSLLSRRRSLSPLERISTMLPQDALSPELMQLREQNQPHEEETCMEEEHGSSEPLATMSKQQQNPVLDASNGASLKECNSDTCTDVAAQSDTSKCHFDATRWMLPAPPQKTTIAYGELLVAEYHRKGRVEFKKMFQLQIGTRLMSSWGIILHDDVVQQPAGHFQRTSRGIPIFIRRASLDDYVLYMKRGPAISYPKDASAMLMMMDVTEGDCVLEAGSGSGAMSLFLSRAVGSRGSVLSVDVRDDHLRRAMLNYQRWRDSWRARQGVEWPDNIEFHHADLCTASSLLARRAFDAVALDLINPQLVLPNVIPHLQPGAVCAVYLANITQVIDLLEGLRCSALPLLCERIFEVPIRDWLVGPALLKDGRYCSKKAPTLNEAPSEEGDTSDEAEQVPEEHPAFGSIPYIARPHPQQLSHSAFLVKLRKFVR
ncbi:tRNA (adenine(58)-N(1))-methyltransferase, mitochondrial [Hippocampus comes]|uniref:tRNA (adenine(58)-N(1))-methyltransferase n=1 Tax=Hippocampus comes TaxID=109280 RepID=A0A3Q2XPT5_HIPCM|nr:PREDICTED: tRNA (adenine(58)-N(1))-methyltransferase, mitochondrial [Hippocampus comes]XP_019731718.1 PREDICTED: tRNA (adenine(58)-N(1))-methyltransferase, mitochondrial [Hippocampus comes]